VTGEHTEIALRARDVDLGDLAAQQQLLRRDEVEMESGHDVSDDGGQTADDGKIVLVS
jgi:hypothetical protein